MNLRYRVHAFWQYVISVQNELETCMKQGSIEQLQELKKELDTRLETISGCKVELEYVDGFYELTFDSHDNKTTQYICALLKKDAPKSLVENWIINSFRQPLSERAYHTVLEVKGKKFTGSDFKIYYHIDEINRCIPIQVYCEGLCDLEKKQQHEVVHYMLELFIGELELEARITSIEILKEPSKEDNVCLLPNFYEDICDIIVDQDWTEYHDPTQIYMAYKIDEKGMKEGLRKDMKLITTTNPLLQEELLNKEDDSCREFLSKGGEYGYLYYEPTQQKEAIALVRKQLEQEIQELLYPLSIARTIGGAIGTRYAYIDLAVFDRDSFLRALKKLQEHLPFDIYYKPFAI